MCPLARGLAQIHPQEHRRALSLQGHHLVKLIRQRFAQRLHQPVRTVEPDGLGQIRKRWCTGKRDTFGRRQGSRSVTLTRKERRRISRRGDERTQHESPARFPWRTRHCAKTPPTTKCPENMIAHGRAVARACKPARPRPADQRLFGRRSGKDPVQHLDGGGDPRGGGHGRRLSGSARNMLILRHITR
jgi:hypothetical protein